MKMHRRDFALWAGSSLVITALPRIALADSDDTITPSKDGVHTSGSKHHDPAPTADHLQHAWNFGFHSQAIAQDQWKYVFPENGQASFLLDYKGNWLYQGSFPSSKLSVPCRTTVGLGLKSVALGTIFAFTKTLTISSAGGSWTKQGNQPMVADLWKDIVKGGHDWKWSAHTRHEVPNEPPPRDPSGNGGGGDSTATDVGDDIAKSLLGPIGFFL